MFKKKQNFWKKQIDSGSNISSSFNSDDYEAD